MSENVALTPEEQRRLKPLFEKYDLEDSSIILGDRIRSLLEQSGLPPLQLGQIWQIVDTDNRGFLDFQAFAKCMRLIAHAQQGLQISPRLANIPSGMPDFSRKPTPMVASPMTTGTATVNAPLRSPDTTTGEMAAKPAIRTESGPFVTGGASMLAPDSSGGIPLLTTSDKSRFGQLFDRSTPQNAQYIDGPDAREIFLKARLPEEILAQIWTLVDIEGRGKLTKNEFVVAMHLIHAKITNSIIQLPSQLPASWQPWLGSGSRHDRKTSVQSHIAIPIANKASTIINHQERMQYDAIFDSLDPQKRGILGPQEAVPVLTKSGLAEDVLAKVWDLADTRSRGQLDRGDFALAMHFIKAKLNGLELPDVVGPGAGDASYQPVKNDKPSTQSQHTVPSPPKVLHRSATTQMSPISDLVSLDSAVFTPLEPSKPKRAQTEVDESKFVPTTAFGQQLLANKGVSPSSVATSVQGTSTSIDVKPSLSPKFDANPNVSQPSEADITAQKASAAKANEELALVLKRKAEYEQSVRELRQTYDNEAKLVHETQEKVKSEQEIIKNLERDLALRSSSLEAMRAQHMEQQKELTKLVEKKQGIEEKIKQIETEHNENKSAIDSFNQDMDAHSKLMNEYSTKFENLTNELKIAKQRRTQIETEFKDLKQKVAVAHEDMRKTEEEVILERQKREKIDQEMKNLENEAVKVKAQADKAQSELEAESMSRKAAESKIESLRTEISPIPTKAVGTTRLVTPGEPGVTASPLATPQANISSIRSKSANVPTFSSGTTSSAAAIVSPPPQSGFPTTHAIPDSREIPRDSSETSFDLPMVRPVSVSSSVMNNAPLSVRGDLGSENGSSRDGFEFVDANGRDSSDDDEGPDDVIPRRYTEATTTPPMPGAFPEVKASANSNEIHAGLNTNDEIKNNIGFEQSPEYSSKPEYALKDPKSSYLKEHSNDNEKTNSSSFKTVHTAPRDEQTGSIKISNYADVRQSDSKASETPILTPDLTKETPDNHPLSKAQPSFTPYESNLKSDDFDDFDDLEEAKEDESDAHISFNSHNHGVPDEWQQLFAPSTQSENFQSSEVTELTSMGFSSDAAKEALKLHKNNLSEATNYLLDQS